MNRGPAGSPSRASGPTSSGLLETYVIGRHLPSVVLRDRLLGEGSVLLAGAGGPLGDVVDHRRVGQRGDVAEMAALGHVLEQATHDLARAGLGQIGGEDDRGRPGDLAD